MCTQPLTIKNPYYKIGDKGINYLHNTHSLYVNVPCGHCKQCISMRQAWVNQRIQMESLRSHLFMLMWSYNRNVCYTNTKGYKVMYPNYKHVQDAFKRMRKDGYKFRYWIISEYGRKKKRPHYHGIIAIDKEDYPDVHVSTLEQTFHKVFLDYWSINIGSKRYPKYIPLLDYVVKRHKRTYDFKHIIPVPGHDNDVSFYCSKYILKYDKRTEKLLKKIELDVTLSDEETKLLRSQIKPRSIMSKDFGSYKLPAVKKYIDSCLARSPDLPQFFDLYTGQKSLLSPYYRKHLLPVDYMQSVYERLSKGKDIYSMDLSDDFSIYELSIDSDLKFRHQQSLNKIKFACNDKY